MEDPSHEPNSTPHAQTGKLKDELAAALPEGFRCKVRYVHTPPKRCDPLFSPPPGAEPETTRLASHLLTMSVNLQDASDPEKKPSVFAFAVEVLVYATKRLTTVFVSKADSTGYLPQQRPSPAKTVTTTFLQWLSAKERNKNPKRKLVISLFARAQSQYLFPGSAENSGKHVLDDRRLIKWWARVLDPIFPKGGDDQARTEAGDSEYDGYITVPGYEGTEIRPFLPPQNYSSGCGPHWKSGNPLPELAETRGIPQSAPPRCLLPRFPDDPKARFMQDLDDEVGISEDTSATISPSKRRNSKWKVIRDLDRFWEAMEFRQECSSGRVVGFVWLVIRTKVSADSQTDYKKEDAMKGAFQDPEPFSLLDVPSSDPVSQNDDASTMSGSFDMRRRKPLSGPIIPRQPRLKGGSSSMTATSDLNGMLDNEAGDGLVLTKEGYDKALQTLLHLDFANLNVASQSTAKWIADVSSIGGIQTDWSLDVTGIAKLEAVAKNNNSTGIQGVNDLGGMIKKRKAEDPAIGKAYVETTDREKPAVSMLSASMIRKKSKPAVT